MIRNVLFTATLLLGSLGLLACSDAVSPLPGAASSNDAGPSSNNNDAGTP